MVQKEEMVATVSKLSARFLTNHGQIHEKAKFYSKGLGVSTFFTSEDIRMVLMEKEETDHENLVNPKKRMNQLDKKNSRDQQDSRKGVAVSLQFIDANPDVVIEGQKSLEGNVNYLKGNDPTQWKAEILTYAEVVYRNLWDGIDLICREQQGS